MFLTLSWSLRRPGSRSAEQKEPAGDSLLEWVPTCRDDDGALDHWVRSKAVSRYDHPSAAAAPGTPVLATALQICRPLRRAETLLRLRSWGLFASLAAPQALCSRALRALSEVNNVPLLDGMHEGYLFYFNCRIRSCRNCRSGSCWVSARAFS
jgi:hypothetical protein